MAKYTGSVSVFNGNGKRYTLEVPTLLIAKFGNETAKKHFERNTGLKLKEMADCYTAKPKSFKQLYKVFVTYNWKTTFYNNAMYSNTLSLKHNTD